MGVTIKNDTHLPTGNSNNIPMRTNNICADRSEEHGAAPEQRREETTCWSVRGSQCGEVS